MRLLKLVPDNTNFNFLRWRNVAMAISGLLLAASIALIAVKGLNFGVDFAGDVSQGVTDGAQWVGDKVSDAMPWNW